LVIAIGYQFAKTGNAANH